jgi:hypothetical protein
LLKGQLKSIAVSVAELLDKSKARVAEWQTRWTQKLIFNQIARSLKVSDSINSSLCISGYYIARYIQSVSLRFTKNRGVPMRKVSHFSVAPILGGGLYGW